MKKIYISYAHRGEGKQVTESLDKAFQARDVLIERDIRNVKYKGSFGEFMAQLGAGEYVITVIDKPYLESKNCMHELIEVYKNEQFRERVFPIVLPDSGIFNTLERIKYIAYWENKTKELEEAMRGVGLANLQGIQEELNLYTEIRQTFAAITNILGDMNAMQLASHSEEDFKTVFEAIHDRISENTDTTPPLPALEGKALVQNHIAQGDTTAAIKAFLKIATATNQNGLYNDLILLSGRNNSNEKSYQANILSHQNYDIAKARIAAALNSYLADN